MSFFRNLLSRFAAAANAPAIQRPPPVVSTKAATRIPIPVAKGAPPRREPAPTRIDPANPPEDCAALPLKAITDLFPPELKAALHKQPSDHVLVHIPRALIQPQLAAGVVRITFAELRAAAGEIFFHPGVGPADVKVLLPLESVLRQMMPCRRDDQRQPAIPVNIPSIFLKAGQSNGSPARGTKEAWYSQRRPSYESPPDSNAGPSTPENGKKPYQPLATGRPRRGSEPAAAPPVALAAPPVPTAAPPIPPAPAAPSTPPDSFAIPLAAVLAVLPPEIRQALNDSDAKTAFLHVPLGGFDTRMRTGKLLFKWEQLREWCTVELPASAAPDLEIDLPLPVVVPLFMAARKTPDARKQVEVDSRIPDVFAQSNKAAPTVAEPPPPVLAEPAPAPVSPPPPPQPATPPPAAPPPAALQPAPGATGPSQLIKRIRALEGVSGAFIATADGLLVAGDVPDASEDVLAAFAPTVFVQLTKYADMARLGLPESVDIHLAGKTVHVRKTGKLYLGVLMPAGRPIPLQELIRISTDLQPHAS